MEHFLDSSDVVRTPDDVVHVWVESIPQGQLDRYYQKNKDTLVKKAAVDYIVGYVPRFFQLPSVKSSYNKEQLANIASTTTVYELIVNTHRVNPASKIQYAIDCSSNRRIKPIFYLAFDSKGNITRSEAATNAVWIPVIPDSNGQWLSELICSSPKQSG